jgi:hypothetical protein
VTTRSRIKTEHAGAKNGRGHGAIAWSEGESRVKRRHDDRAEVEERVEDARADSSS